MNFEEAECHSLQRAPCKPGQFKRCFSASTQRSRRVACASFTSQSLSCHEKVCLLFEDRSAHCATLQRNSDARHLSLARGNLAGEHTVLQCRFFAKRHQQLLAQYLGRLSKQFIPLAVQRIDPARAMRRTPSLYSPPKGGDVVNMDK